MPLLFALIGLAMGPPDEELVRRFKEGDRHAFSLLVERYQDRVFTLCVRWMGNRQVAEEVAQDVFIALFRSLARFRGDSKLSTWIFRVTVNHCKNRKLYRHRRQQDRHEPLEGKQIDDDAPARQLADEKAGTDKGLHRSEAERVLANALAKLDDSHRTILVLRDIEDLAYEEISEILELPKGTVKSRLHRARAELARVLGRSITKEDVFE